MARDGNIVINNVPFADYQHAIILCKPPMAYWYWRDGVIVTNDQ